MNTAKFIEGTSLLDEYDSSKQIFIKYQNNDYNKRGKKQFLASIFIPI